MSKENYRGVRGGARGGLENGGGKEGAERMKKGKDERGGKR